MVAGLICDQVRCVVITTADRVLAVMRAPTADLTSVWVRAVPSTTIAAYRRPQGGLASPVIRCVVGLTTGTDIDKFVSLRAVRCRDGDGLSGLQVAATLGFA